MSARTSQPILPQSILDELNGNSSSQGRTSGRNRDHGPPHQFSRKAARKQERQQRKSRKAEYHTKNVSLTRPSSSLFGKRPAIQEHEHSPQHKKLKTTHSTLATASAYKFRENDKNSKPKKFSAPTSGPSSTLKAKVRKTTALELLAGKPSPKALKFSQSRTQKEKDEDSYIQYLEGKLGWTKNGQKTRKYGSGLEDEGWGDLLDGLDDFVRGDSDSDAGELPFEQDTDNEENYTDDESLLSKEDAAGPNSLSEQEDIPSMLDPVDNPDDESDWGGINVGGSSSETLSSSSHVAPIQDISSQLPVATNRYVPPALRNRSVEDQNSEEIIKLRRQLKGLLNRLSEQNISSILDSVEDMYRKHRRHDISSTLTTLLIESVSSHANLLDSYVALNAALVAALHKIIGLEFGAYFVQHLVAAYETHYAAMDSNSKLDVTVDNGNPAKTDTGKEASNLLVLLTELYNFQVISCVLIYDIIRLLLDGQIFETDVELLLKITRSSGQQLRMDDPSALKDIVQLVQDRVAGKHNALSSRTRFMLETLTNLKNNKLRKTNAPGNAGQTGGTEAVERLKKFLAGIGKKRHVLAHEPLRTSLSDLRTAESRGKWWLVGAAWGGDPLAERAEELTQQQQRRRPTTNKSQDNTEDALLRLARKQGMNTDIRRSIFVVLMSSDDYVDACERLAQLNLTEVQQREVVRVILHCCGKEKAYNPYYTLTLQQLCSHAHAHKITLQFYLWDFLRELGEAHVGGAEILKGINKDEDDGGAFGDGKKVAPNRAANLARAYGWFLAKNSVTLAILKPVDFSIIKSQTRAFLRDLFVHLFTSSQNSSPAFSGPPTTQDRAPLEEVFLRAARIPTLATGIMYFLGEEFGKHKTRDEWGAFVHWASGVARDTLRTGVDVVPNL